MPDGSTGRLLVDTGDPMGVGLSAALWHDWRAAHPRAPSTTRVYATPGIGMIEREEAWADEIQLGNLRLTDVPVYEVPAGLAEQFDNLAGTLGMYALSRMDLVVDANHRTAYAHPRPPPGPAYPGLKRPGGSQDSAKDQRAGLDWVVTPGVNLQRSSFLVLAARYKVFNKDFDGAIADCDQALNLDPGNQDALVARGGAKDGKEDYAGATADFSRVIELAPENIAARLARAQLRLDSADTAGAITDLDAVLSSEPENATAVTSRAEARQINGDFAGALADFGAAMRLDPDNSNYFRLYARLLQMRMGAPPPGFSQTIAGWKHGWPRTLGRFIEGEVSERQLLSAAQHRGEEPVIGQQCEAHYFIGILRLLQGDDARRPRELRKMRRHRPEGLFRIFVCQRRAGANAGEIDDRPVSGTARPLIPRRCRHREPARESAQSGPTGRNRPTPSSGGSNARSPGRFSATSRKGRWPAKYLQVPPGPQHIRRPGRLLPERAPQCTLRDNAAVRARRARKAALAMSLWTRMFVPSQSKILSPVRKTRSGCDRSESRARASQIRLRARWARRLVSDATRTPLQPRRMQGLPAFVEAGFLLQDGMELANGRVELVLLQGGQGVVIGLHQAGRISTRPFSSRAGWRKTEG